MKNDIAERIQQERDIHSNLSQHPSIVTLEATLEDEENIYMVLELCKGGDLAGFLRQDPKGRLSDRRAKRWMYQLALGISFLHDKCKVIHRDLKLSNMLLFGDSDKQTLKISDFGLAVQLKEVAEEHYTFCGTPNFIAPEVLQEDTSHGLPADIWSFGCTIFSLLTGDSPFQGCRVRYVLLFRIV